MKISIYELRTHSKIKLSYAGESVQGEPGANGAPGINGQPGRPGLKGLKGEAGIAKYR